jgi:hypothetical protein
MIGLGQGLLGNRVLGETRRALVWRKSRQTSDGSCAHEVAA